MAVTSFADILVLFEAILDEDYEGSTMHPIKMNVVGRSVTALAIGLALSLGSVSLASASSHDHGRWGGGFASARVSPFDYANAGLGGYVTAVTMTTVTITEWNGTSATFNLTGTTYTAGNEPATWSSLVVGDRVRIQVSPSDPTTALSVNIELAMLFGTVSGVSGETITITDWQGFTRTILASTTGTTFTVGGVPGGTIADVTTGAKILALGTVDPDGTTLDALSIFIGSAGNNEFVRGTITAFTSSSVTVLQKNGTSTTFTYTTSTVFKDRNVTLSAADLVMGERVGVWFNSSAATTALGIEIKLVHLSGTVTGVSSATITITDHDGFSRNILTDPTTTTFYLGGVTVTISSVLSGDNIKAYGVVGTDLMTLDAIVVDIGSSGGSGGHHHHGFGLDAGAGVGLSLGGTSHDTFGGRGHNRR